MRIVHFAPFAPCGCGLYEAARDMMIGDRKAGHDAHFVDTGPTTETVHTEGKPGQIDTRGGSELRTEDPEIALYADVIVAHTGIPDNWIVKTTAPILWIMHGRPAACFKPEQFGKGMSYSLIKEIGEWPRVKAMVTFWPYHVQFWKPIIEENKIVCFSAPPIDEIRFSPDGTRHDFKNLGGKYNIMVAESWRDDIDIYEITNGIIEYAKHARGQAKFHFYGMETPLRCWEYLIAKLRHYDALGELWGRRPDIEEVYRAADLLLSPQRIVTRTVGEALSCGTPVIAAKGCSFATWTVKPDEPGEVADIIGTALNEIGTIPDEIERRVRESASQFTLKEYSDRMNKLYERIA